MKKLLGTLLFSFLLCSYSLAGTFLNPSSYNLSEILPDPPKPGSLEAKTDQGFLKDSMAIANDLQRTPAVAASHDGPFDYKDTLGPWFTKENLPKTAEVLGLATKDAKEAIELAKNYYKRERPTYWKETGDPEKSDGFSYPSGHTTRAFLWADLLGNAFPEKAKALHHQARQKAWFRVILGRHFPADVKAGKVYGKFLAKEFLNNDKFEKQWAEAKQEIATFRKDHGVSTTP